MPHMTFDRKVPVPNQRRWVAEHKSHAPKRHGTGKRKSRSAIKKRGQRAFVLIKKGRSLVKAKRATRRYWSGDWI